MIPFSCARETSLSPPDRVGSRERGSASIGMVILLPALFGLMFLGLQAALMFQGRAVLIAAAQEGARATASEAGSTGSGKTAAAAFVAQSNAGMSGVSVTATRSATTAVVTVTGRTLSVIPGWNPTITQSATLPVERLTR